MLEKIVKEIAEIAEIVTPKMQKKHRPKLVRFVQMSKLDTFVYSAFAIGKNKLYYLSSRFDALYMNEFENYWFDTHASNKKDYVAYYDTKEHTKMAIVWRVCFGNHERNLFHLPWIQELFENKDQLALFRSVNGSSQFFCLLVQTNSGKHVYLPDDYDDDNRMVNNVASILYINHILSQSNEIFCSLYIFIPKNVLCNIHSKLKLLPFVSTQTYK